MGVGKMEQEAGLHRIQRIPFTEKKGRVHTSDVSVVAWDNTQKVVEHTALLRDKEHFHLEWYSGSGAGGQHRNKHMNCARLTHLPTGIVQTAQYRNRQQSFMEAEKALLFLLDEKLQNANSHFIQQIKTNQQQQNLARKRLWSFQRDSVEDTNGLKMSCNKAMKGYMDSLWK